jgi:uncharacterized protein
MSTELPVGYDCHALGTSRRALVGTVPAKRLERLPSEFRARQAATVELELCGRADASCAVQGTVTAVIEAQCQRCLEWLSLPLSVSVDVMASATGAAPRDGEVDTVELNDGWLDVYKLIEDEVLLNLPLVPMHASNNCVRAQSEPANAAKRRPFAELGTLLATASPPSHRERN